MKILITGASGFVGSFLVEHGLELGHEVWAALRSTSSRRYLTDPRIRFIELNLGDDATLRRQLSDHGAAHGASDCVIHAPGATKAADLEAFRRTNTAGTRRLARTLRELDLLRGRFVFVSSLSVMGPVADPVQRVPAEAYRPIADTDRPAPNTAYGYIQKGEELGDQRFSLKTFTEKPPLDFARQFVASGEFLWNTGLFLWNARTMLPLVGQLIPGLPAADAPIPENESERSIL